MKKVWLLMCAALMIVFIAACAGSGTGGGQEAGSDSGSSGGSSEGGGSDEGSSDGEIELRMSWWGSQARHDMTEEIITMYEEENPNVTINTEFSGFDGYFERMAAQASGGNLPDIMQQNFGEYVNQYAGEGLLADLGPYIEDGTINLEGVEDTVVESGQVDGTQVGIPTGTNAMMVAYNPEAFEGTDVEMPSNDWTWQEYMDITSGISEATGQYGVSYTEPDNFFEYYLRENGKAMFNEDGTGLGYEDDQLLADYFSMMKQQIDNEVSPDYSVVDQIQGLEDELITRGETSIHIKNWSNQFQTLQNTTDTPLEIAMMPGENNDQGMFQKPSMLWSIGENSEHKEQAADFINFYTNTVEVFEVIGGDRGVPIKPDVREALRESGLTEAQEKIFDYLDVVAENSSAPDTNFPASASEVLQALKDTDEMVMYGEMTPQEGAEHFRQEAESILSEQ
ncbi:ABC transporter substrate-binding protein [Salibacterium qingdaonense]|uniref:Multiple sugar transport system substrate-binding protein n=1 Tax=Salibacterium qingdaonense TaxID=266892 RepID=A0A1I4HWE7_9BACI|nr:ABC transporter substrate-binding protein [Salibacterium qingdaonense]SFL45961.1 multiple sugar transport system substrate-binding protein [Salibacterium qingdaonense]